MADNLVELTAVPKVVKTAVQMDMTLVEKTADKKVGHWAERKVGLMADSKVVGMAAMSVVTLAGDLVAQ
jgi:hypothetical protein